MSDITIAYPDDETLVIYAKGIEVGSYNHDAHGWAGMTEAVELVKKIATELYLSVDEEGEPNV